jgi:hypothetical protein
LSHSAKASCEDEREKSDLESLPRSARNSLLADLRAQAVPPIRKTLDLQSTVHF